MSLFTLRISEEEQYGPVALETLRAWAREGRIEAKHTIYDHTHMRWVEAPQLPEIQDFFKPKEAAPVPVATPPAQVVPAAPVKKTVKLKDLPDDVVHSKKKTQALDEIQIHVTPAKKKGEESAPAGKQKSQKISRKISQRIDTHADKKRSSRTPKFLKKIGQIFKPLLSKKVDPSKKKSQKI